MGVEELSIDFTYTRDGVLHCSKMGKLAYPTMLEADIGKVIADYDYPKKKHSIYKCFFCGHFHLTTHK